MNIDQLYTAAQAAKEIGISRQRLFRLYSRGRIAPIYLGARVFLLKSQVHKLAVELEGKRYTQKSLDLGEGSR